MQAEVKRVRQDVLRVVDLNQTRIWLTREHIL